MNKVTPDLQFSPIQGEVVQKPKAKPKSWAGVVAPNRDRSNGVDLKFIAPLKKDGVKLVKFDDVEVADEVKRWKKALIVYVVSAKPPFGLMEQFFKKRWWRFGEFKLFLLKSGVYVVQFGNVRTRNEGGKAMVL